MLRPHKHEHSSQFNFGYGNSLWLQYEQYHEKSDQHPIRGKNQLAAAAQHYHPADMEAYERRNGDPFRLFAMREAKRNLPPIGSEEAEREKIAAARANISADVAAAVSVTQRARRRKARWSDGSLGRIDTLNMSPEAIKQASKPIRTWKYLEDVQRSIAFTGIGACVGGVYCLRSRRNGYVYFSSGWDLAREKSTQFAELQDGTHVCQPIAVDVFLGGINIVEFWVVLVVDMGAKITPSAYDELLLAHTRDEQVKYKIFQDVT